MSPDGVRARAALVESLGLFREVGDHRGAAATACALGLHDLRQGEPDAARAWFAESARLAGDPGNDYLLANSFLSLAQIGNTTGEFAEARAHRERSLAILERLGDRQGKTYALATLGISALEVGERAKARSYAETSLALSAEAGIPEGGAFARHVLGLLSFEEGDAERAPPRRGGGRPGIARARRRAGGGRHCSGRPLAL